jgi:hypothetical protein
MKTSSAILLGFCSAAALCLLLKKKENAPAIGGMGGTEPSFGEFVRRSIEDKKYNATIEIEVNEKQAQKKYVICI